VDLVDLVDPADRAVLAVLVHPADQAEVLALADQADHLQAVPADRAAGLGHRLNRSPPSK